VELLVVFAIISVLVSLISSAVWKAMITASRVRIRSEISQLAVALENFKAKYGFYPPSRIKLAELLTTGPSGIYRDASIQGSLDYDSIQTITKMFPKASTAWANANPANGPAGINWSGRGGWNGPNPMAFTVLEGDQCLVFFLGGIPDNFSGPANLNCTGFSTNLLDPSYHIKNGGETLPPFFEFDSSRLVRAAGQGSPRSPVFYSYLDSYRQRPYAYFSSGNSRDNYNRHFIEAQYRNSDCRSLLANPSNPQAGTVWPYAEAISPTLGALTVPSPRYYNPSSFQIITAGADGLFGTGTIIQSADGRRGHPPFPPNSAFYSTSDPGFDDLSNFRDSILGNSN
jgi:general secretion pathway protein G